MTDIQRCHISDSSAAIALHYNALEQKWNVQDRSDDYGRLVVPNSNGDEPVHRWFRMKEAYSSALFTRLAKDAGYEADQEMSILDPFAGSGTTALSALEATHQWNAQCRCTLVERNPVLRIVASAKVAGLLRGAELAEVIEHAVPSVMREYSLHMRRWRTLTTGSVTLNNVKYYSPQHTRSLLGLSRAIRVVGDVDARSALQTCLASSVEPAGRLRRDGRALRFTPERQPMHPVSVFSAFVNRCLSDLRSVEERSARATVRVIEGDAREADVHASDGSYQWVVFSPPYPNNIDYTEVYKTEAWVLGCYDDAAAMKTQRLATIRSHTSVYFPERYLYQSSPFLEQIEAVIGPLLAAVPSDRYEKGRRQLIAGYADDMLCVFRSLRRVVHPDGRLAFVVGNSVHGAGEERFVIAADVLLSALAEMVGWRVEELRVARRLRRRAEDLEHLRESVVVLRPN
jgi:hypothetical protein